MLSRTTLSSMAIAVCATCAFADFEFPEEITTTADGVLQTVAGDIDGDGDADIVVPSLGNDRVAWYENLRADGKLWIEHVIDMNLDAARGVGIADFDDQNGLDIAAVGSGDNWTQIYFNQGGGEFAAPVQLGNLETADAVLTVADLNGDTFDDILVGDDVLIAYINDSSNPGTFTLETLSTGHTDIRVIYPVDIDGDTDVDILFSDPTRDRLCLIENLGNGSFDPFETIDDQQTNPSGIVALDLLGDTDPEILLGTDSGIRRYGRDGNGWTSTLVTNAVTGKMYLALGDPDGDGDEDLLIGDYDSDRVGLILRDGANFGIPMNIGAALDGVSSVMSIDIDGDTDEDVIYSAELDDEVGWLENDRLENLGAILASSTFDSDREDWGTVGDAGIFVWTNVGGNPGGFIKASDLGSGGHWYFVAPDKFLGDMSAAFRGTLSFDLKTDSPGQTSADDVIIESINGDIVYQDLVPPGTDWTHYAVPLDISGNWINSEENRPATTAEIQSALSNIAAIRIRGEYSTGADTGSLDNVIIRGTNDPLYPPTQPGLHPVLHAQITSPSIDPNFTNVTYRYDWQSSGDDPTVSHGPTAKLDDSLLHNTEGVTLDAGETWEVTVTPIDELGTEGEPAIGSFIIGTGGQVTFEGWQIN